MVATTDILGSWKDFDDERLLLIYSQTLATRAVSGPDDSDNVVAIRDEILRRLKTRESFVTDWETNLRGIFKSQILELRDDRWIFMMSGLVIGICLGIMFG